LAVSHPTQKRLSGSVRQSIWLVRRHPVNMTHGRENANTYRQFLQTGESTPAPVGEHLAFSLLFRQTVAADARLIRLEKEFPAIGSLTPLSDRFEAVPKTTWQWR